MPRRCIRYTPADGAVEQRGHQVWELVFEDTEIGDILPIRYAPSELSPIDFEHGVWVANTGLVAIIGLVIIAPGGLWVFFTARSAQRAAGLLKP